MFDLADRSLVWIPIKWTVLRPPESGEGEDPLAAEVEVSIEVEVELLDRDELVKFFGDELGIEREDGEKREGDLEENAPADATPPTRRELEVRRFSRLVKNWRKFKNRGESVPFNAENVAKLLAVPGVVSAFEAAYLAACAGKADIRRGN